MELRVLGCSGGVGSGLRTTTLMIDDDILIDAGTGLGDLTLDEMAHIRHIFLTHSHLDHITSIPLLVDSIFDRISQPIIIHGLATTLDALRQHIFNNVIWPDFSRLPHPAQPVMAYAPMAPGELCVLADRSLEMISVNHVVPGVGYRVTSSAGCFAFSGDTSTNDNFWHTLNARGTLDLLIVESAFTNEDIELSRRAGHYCPTLLAVDLDKLDRPVAVYISHNKPGDETAIFNQCRESIRRHAVHRLSGGARFTL